MQTIGKWFIYLITRLLFSTYRIQHVDREYNFVPRDGNKLVAALWHEHLFMGISSEMGSPLAPIASKNSGGRMIGYVLSKLGFDTVYGSANRNGKDKGGFRALRELTRRMRAGKIPAFAVDGSIGPRREVKQGVAYLAQTTGAKVVPVGCVADRYWEFNTWDRLKLPKPFARIYTVYGTPIAIDKSTDAKDMTLYQDKIKRRINACEALAQATMEQSALQGDFSVAR